MTNPERNFRRYASDFKHFLADNEVDMYLGSEYLNNIAVCVTFEEPPHRILIGSTLIQRSWKNALVAFLHEVGHFMTHYYDIYHQKPKNRRMDEMLAWMMAELLLEDLNWPIPRSCFLRARRSGLRSHGIKR